jgi:hypothetical protein
MPTPRFSDEQVDAAIDYLIEQAAEDRAASRSYSLVFRAAGLDAPQDLYREGAEQIVSKFMEAVHWRCPERKLPPLDALVVHVTGPRENHPGSGYFRVNNLPDPFDSRTPPKAVGPAFDFWKAEVARCRAWGIDSRRGRTFGES